MFIPETVSLPLQYIRSVCSPRSLKLPFDIFGQRIYLFVLDYIQLITDKYIGDMGNIAVIFCTFQYCIRKAKQPCV